MGDTLREIEEIGPMGEKILEQLGLKKNPTRKELDEQMRKIFEEEKNQPQPHEIPLK